MLKIKINEIFYSLQMEGRNTGMPAIFIRFSGCNLRCSFCDTKHSYGRRMTLREIVNRLKQFNCQTVVITGGEPTIQAVDELATLLTKRDYFVCIETNGTGLLDIHQYDWITISPKNGRSKLATWRCDEVKVVYRGQSIKHWLNEIIANYYYLQPCSMKNVKKTVNMVKKYPKWRLSGQWHKILNIK